MPTAVVLELIGLSREFRGRGDEGKNREDLVDSQLGSLVRHGLAI